MNETRFSVSMCVYGGDNAEWFEVAVNSILNQTVAPDEVVLVVDGPVPTDLNAVISRYESISKFKVIRFEKNMGHGEARRAGLSACTCPLVAIMDADDISVPDRFEKQLAQFQHNKSLDIVGGNISEFIDTVDNLVGIREVPQGDNAIKIYMKKRSPMNQMTVMFKKAAVESVGGYQDWFCNEDYYLWIRMALANCSFANIPDVLVNVRVGKDMYQRRGGKKYFESEIKLQKYMLENQIINRSTYRMNYLKRLIVQRLLPNKLRGWVFKTFARKQV